MPQLVLSSAQGGQKPACSNTFYKETYLFQTTDSNPELEEGGREREKVGTIASAAESHGGGL